MYKMVVVITSFLTFEHLIDKKSKTYLFSLSL